MSAIRANPSDFLGVNFYAPHYVGLLSPDGQPRFSHQHRNGTDVFRAVDKQLYIELVLLQSLFL